MFMVDDGANSQGDFPFEWVQTQDGSMTLKPLAQGSEWMHSLLGAYSETQYIYGESLRLSLKNWQTHPPSYPIKILSMGLGLGYVEVLVVLEATKAQVPFELHTFESEVSLKNHFLQECQSPKSFSYLEIFKKDYDEKFWNEALNFFRQVAEKNQQSSQKALNNLPSHLQASSFHLHGSLNSRTLKESKGLNQFHLIFYDAYSKQSQEDLWSEDFLKDFIQQTTHPKVATFSTYASTSNLKRALKSQGFELLKRPGFGNKRESTLALKNRSQLD